MAHALPPLPFGPNELEPFLSAETLSYHHGKHHKAYVDNLNRLTVGTGLDDVTLEELIRSTDGGVFNNAAQVWNHTFYWNCLRGGGGGRGPGSDLAERIETVFGGVDEFRDKFTAAAAAHFGSGWAWLIRTTEGSLAITTTANAGNPIRDGATPLLTCDVWEHAYYIDYRNARLTYLKSFWDWVDWDFVASNL